MDMAKAAGMMAARSECHLNVAKIPGVFATSVGFRQVAGVTTNELAVCVHVREKRALRDLHGIARIPAFIDGVPIDIAEGRPPKLAASKERPVFGGIEVQGSGVHYGTLGCMVKDKEGKDRQNYMLSNEHVFGGVGTKTYQPATGRVCDQMGWVTKAESLSGGQMDCAISSLKKYDDGGLPTIQGIGTVKGQRSPSGKVSKSGAHTGVTHGSVVDVDYQVIFDDFTVKNQFRIDCDPEGKTFAEQGDSGAAIVSVGTGNDSGKCWVCGLLWGVGSTKFSSVNRFGFATPIEAVLEKMGVELLTEAGQSLTARVAAQETALDRIAALLSRSRRGQGYWEAFTRNRDSLQRLFAESPRLSVELKDVPLEALMDTVLQAGAEPESLIPSRIGNLSTDEVVTSFSMVLGRHIEDGELRRHIEDLARLIRQNVGRSWVEALSNTEALAHHN